VTNVRDPGIWETPVPRGSRGILVRDFLLSPQAPASFAADLLAEVTAPSPWNLLLGRYDRGAWDVLWAGGRVRRVERLGRGVHVLSNAELGTPWPKVRWLGDALRRGVAADVEAVLGSTRTAADDELPDTGVGRDLERSLSAALVVGERYHTRCTTIVRLGPGGAQVRELSRGPDGRVQGVVEEALPARSGGSPPQRVFH
jgi:uncharacterized protein with NRDE domain